MINSDGNGGSHIPTLAPGQLKLGVGLVISVFALAGIVFGMGVNYAFIKSDIESNTDAIKDCADNTEFQLRYERIEDEIKINAVAVNRVEQKVDELNNKFDKYILDKGGE